MDDAGPDAEADADADADAGAGDAGGLPGRRFVLGIYLVIVGIAGVFGYIIGLVRPENLDPRLFMLVELPPTPLGMAVYGVVTVAAMLGVLLGAVQYVSRFDTAEPAGPRPDSGAEETGTGPDGRDGEREW